MHQKELGKNTKKMNRHIILITAEQGGKVDINDMHWAPSGIGKPKKWMYDVTKNVKLETLRALATHLGTTYYGHRIGTSLRRQIQSDCEDYGRSIGMKIKATVTGAGVIMLKSGDNEAEFYIS